MAKWEAIDADGNTHSGDGREALLALVNAGKLTAGDGLYDCPQKAWITVGKYLGPTAAGVKPNAVKPAGVQPPPLDRRQLLLFVAVGGVVLLAVLAFNFADYLLPGNAPVATPHGAGPAATTAGASAAGGETRGENADGTRAPAVAAGEEYNVLIESEGSRGDGLTHVKGMVVFVAGARAGEKMRVRITGVSRTTAQADKIGPATGPVEVAADRPEAGGTAAQAAAGSGDNARPAPVAVGQEYTVKIESVGSRGDGVTHIEGLVVFVAGVRQGDEVKIRITELRERNAVAEVVR